MKKKFALVITLLLFLFLFALIYYTTMSPSLSGTYSVGNEPDKDNINIVLKDKQFTIYNQEKILESGLLEKISLDSKSNIYRLVSGENTNVGYIVHDKKHIILLNFRNMDILLEKISTSAIYLNYELE